MHLPVFQNKKDLNRCSSWKKYLQLVYGKTLKGMPFPYNAYSRLWMLYTNYLKQCGLELILKSTRHTCPTEKGDIFHNMSIYHDYPETIWVYHPRPFQRIKQNTYVEVIHVSDGLSSVHESHNNYWMYYAPGSGIWFNVGKTISFSTHTDAATHFGVERIHYLKNDPFLKLCTVAKEQGFDSIQILNNNDGRCKSKNGTQNMFEIISLNHDGSTTCGGKTPTTTFLKGFANIRCLCDESKSCLNCK